MRIAVLIGQIRKVGGMEKQAILLARELKKRDLYVTLILTGLKKKAATLELDSIKCNYLHYSKYTGWLSDFLMRHYSRTRGITHIIAFNAENAERAITAGMKSRIALSVRGIRFASDPALAEKYRYVASRCYRIVTNSRNTAVLLEESGIASKNDVVVIHNGIELPASGAQPDEKTILWVGSLKDVKDPMTFLEACREVIRSDAEVKVIMAGEGAMRPGIENYLNENGLTENFTLPGEVTYENIPYSKASVFVNSSIRESSSNSMLEALSFGIPVVATDNPGNMDVLSALEDHRIVPASDPARMAKAIGELLDIDDGTRSRIAVESRKYIEDQYSVSKMVDGYIRIFSGE
jgi:glycosyltransferase involved in cell wall biosynthesis